MEQIQRLLPEEWEQFRSEWEKGNSYQGLRVNTLKIPCADFLARTTFTLQPVPWAEEGFYFAGEERPAKHAYYQAGLYYLQEPSAMASAACLGVRPGEKVLDLCAAPGGKSTQLAALLQGQGLLVSNDNSAERVKALVWNLEHWGATNAVITNEEPARLAAVFPEFFDKILVDAPCSGEGMFRKDPRAIKSWSSYNSEVCSELQKEILGQAARMLRPGGRIMYSTCTFSPQENEEVIAAFLKKHPDFTLGSLPLDYGWEPGRRLNDNSGNSSNTERTRRLWPHKVKGEGHFLALLEKKDENQVNYANQASQKNQANRKNQEENGFLEDKGEALAAFMEENLCQPLTGSFLQKGQYLYRVPTGLPSLTGLNVVRYGWFIGTLQKGRFAPSQALAMGLKSSNVKRQVRFSLQDQEVERYLKGETLLKEGTKGWTLVCLEEFPLGWAKQTGDYLKNYYPPGWRLT